MALLKQSFVQWINQTLDNEYFSLADFNIEFPDSGSKLAVIEFAYNPNYYFIIHEGVKREGGSAIFAYAASLEGGDKTPMTTESPGDYKTVEEHYHESFDNCISRISTWCRNIRDDLRTSSPVFSKELDELKKQIEEHLKSHIENPEEPISTAEIESISSRFDDLYAKFEELKERHEITEAQLKEIRNDFEIIKGNASQYSKGLWVNLTASRFAGLLKRIATSPEGRKLMYESAKKLLLG